MSVIALLHPQCINQGGAIQMALQTAGILQEQGHEVILYTFSHSPDCFSELQKNVKIQKWGRGSAGFFPGKKLINIITLAWHCRHVDIIIANNPPMQIVAALAKIFSLHLKKNQSSNFSLFPFSCSTLSSIWWHHHIPWYLNQNNKYKIINNKEDQFPSSLGRISLDSPGDGNSYTRIHGSKSRATIFLKSLFERHLIIPLIDEMIATSHFVAEQVKKYCGREATVIHPIVENRYERIENRENVASTPPCPPQRKRGAGGVEEKIYIPLDNNGGRLDSTLPTGQAGSRSPRANLAAVRSSEEPSLRIPQGVSLSNTGSGRGMTGDGSLRHDPPRDDGGILLFSHGRLEPGKGIETLVNVYKCLEQKAKSKKQSAGIVPNSPLQISQEIGEGAGGVKLIIFGTGSLEKSLTEQGIHIQPFDHNSTLRQLASGQFGHPILGVYCSEIDGFGMAPLESQMMGIPTVILDRAGARETIVSNDVHEPVGYLVKDEEELFRIISRFVQEKTLPKCEANVNFLHHRDYFFRPRLSKDLSNFMGKFHDCKE